MLSHYHGPTPNYLFKAHQHKLWFFTREIDGSSIISFTTSSNVTQLFWSTHVAVNISTLMPRTETRNQLVYLAIWATCVHSTESLFTWDFSMKSVELRATYFIKYLVIIYMSKPRCLKPKSLLWQVRLKTLASLTDLDMWLNVIIYDNFTLSKLDRSS